ncbi:villin-3 [Nicotiana attenuata]|uniref:Villin-3 n=1 Tax=Nicotiana attenuata TaxID=49451 RepID=A0A1J6IX24_NICAT|nr:villin-3 [Nicotiana attenuata]
MFSDQYIWNRFPFNPTAMDLCVWDPGISYMFLALTGSTENVEELLLLGCTCKFPFSNFMTKVWDPGEPWCVTAYILQSNSSLEFLILVLALHDDYKVQHLELDISEKFLLKDIDAFGSNLTATCFNKRLGVRYYSVPTFHLKSVSATFGLVPESLDVGAKWHGKTGELQCMWSNINMWIIVPRQSSHEQQQLVARVLAFLMPRVIFKHTKEGIDSSVVWLELGEKQDYSRTKVAHVMHSVIKGKFELEEIYNFYQDNLLTEDVWLLDTQLSLSSLSLMLSLLLYSNLEDKVLIEDRGNVMMDE